MALRLILFFIVFQMLGLPAFAAAQPASTSISADERVEIEKWTSRDNKKGVLLTPPAGSIQGPVRAARFELERIINKLAGDRLKNESINYVVNIYSNPTPNAWVQEYQSDDQNDSVNEQVGQKQKSPEALWKEKHDTVWPIRRLLGFTDNDRSIYELGITTGLLSLLDSEDELAFVEGHELTHLFDGHTHGVGFKEKWWNSQSNEAVADNGGIGFILGKYEIGASVTALEKLFPTSEQPEKSDDLSVLRAASDGLQAHHHEGVRISMVQFQVEADRRSNLLAEPMELTPLPEALKALKTKSRPRLPSADFEEATLRPLQKILREYFLPNRPFEPLLSTVPFGKGNLTLGTAPTSEQMNILVLNLLEEIENAPVSKAIKVNSFLQVQLAVQRFKPSFTSTGVWPDFWQTLPPETLNRITMFLATNSSGPGAWTYKDFQSIAQQAFEIPWNYLSRQFLGNAKSQKLLFKLKSAFPEWEIYFQSLHEKSAFENRSGSGISTTKLLREIRLSLWMEDGPLGAEHEAALLNVLSKFSPQEIFDEKKDGALVYARLRHEIKTEAANSGDVKRKARAQMFENEIGRFEDPFVNSAIQNAIQITRSRSANFDVQVAAFNFLVDVDFDGLKQDQKDVLSESFLDVIHHYNEQILTVGSPNLVENMSGALIVKISGKLNDTELTHAQKIEILQFLICYPNQPGDYGSADQQLEVKRQVRTFLETLSEKEVLNLVIAINPKMENEAAKLKPLLPVFNGDNDAFQDEQKRLNIRFGVTSQAEARKRLGIFKLRMKMQKNLLNLISINESLPNTFSKIPIADFDLLLSKLASTTRDFFLSFIGKERLNQGQSLPRDAGQALLGLFISSMDEINDFDSWVKTYERVMALTGKEFNLTQAQHSRLVNTIQTRLSGVEEADRYKWLKRKSLRKLLGPKLLANLLLDAMARTRQGDRSPGRLKVEVDRLLKLTNLQVELPEAYRIFRNSLAEREHLQPSDLDKVFQEDQRSITEKASGGASAIRGLSALISITRTRSLSEQLEMINYLMGRQDAEPNFVDYFQNRSDQLSVHQRGFDLEQLLRWARADLDSRSELERAFVVNSFLSGPNSPLEKADGLEFFTNKILEPVQSEKRSMAATIANSLFNAEGRNKSLYIAYVLAQKPDSSQASKELTEALVLKSLLDSYGVPGVKLAQYLAFTDEFAEFATVLESYQDAAMPISYFDMLMLVKNNLGKEWDETKYKITRIIGSGSVNIAIEYKNIETGKTDVLNISRQDIEVKTKEDFRRFRLLMNELNNDPKNGGKFDYVIGLMDIIQKSVDLEFDRIHAFKMQKSVQSLYNRNVDGWRVQTVDAYEMVNSAILMEKAPGVGARQVLKTNPELYKSALSALWKVEYQVLRGVGENGNIVPLPLHANPDLHDGQVLIDAKNKVVTFIDFGQAEKISNQERDLAVDLLRVISGSESDMGAVRLLEKRLKNIYSRDVHLNVTQIQVALSRTNRMDRFVRLISYLNRSGYEMPLSSVHWILAVNRLIKLGEKINIPAEASIRNLIIVKKAGLPLTAYNVGSKLSEGLKKTSGQMPMTCRDLFNK